MRQVRNWSIVALIALAIVVLPGGGPVLNVVLSLLSIAFLAGIALVSYRMYHEQRFTRDSIWDRRGFVLCASGGVALLSCAAMRRLFAAGGLGVLVWVGVVGICSYGRMGFCGSYRRYG